MDILSLIVSISFFLIFHFLADIETDDKYRYIHTYADMDSESSRSRRGNLALLHIFSPLTVRVLLDPRPEMPFFVRENGILQVTLRPIMKCFSSRRVYILCLLFQLRVLFSTMFYWNVFSCMKMNLVTQMIKYFLIWYSLYAFYSR